MRYKGEKSGRNLKLDNFRSESPFYKAVANVADLIKKILEKCPWVSLHRKRRSENNSQKTTRKKIIVEDNGACFEMGTRSLPPFTEKLIGKRIITISKDALADSLGCPHCPHFMVDLLYCVKLNFSETVCVQALTSFRLVCR